MFHNAWGTSQYQNVILVTAEATLRFGVIDIGKVTKDGVQVIYNNTVSQNANFITATNGILDLLGVSLLRTGSGGRSHRIYASALSRVYDITAPSAFIFKAFTGDMSNTTINNMPISFDGPSSGARFDRLSVAGNHSSYPFRLSIASHNVDIRNTRWRDNLYVFLVYFFGDNIQVYITDPDVDTWGVLYGGSSYDNSFIHRRYTFQANVTDKDGNALSGIIIDAKDTNGTAIWPAGRVVTDVNGDSEHQIVWSGIYKWTAVGANNEYYVELDAGGDPSLPRATGITINSAEADEGLIGSLSAGEWVWGDGGGGFDTVIARIAGDGDPDAQADGYILYRPVLDYIKYKAGGPTGDVTLSPHKFTISKAGYETLVLENITISAPIKWHLELQPLRTRNYGRSTRSVPANFE